jgi:hypothetical protein
VTTTTNNSKHEKIKSQGHVKMKKPKDIKESKNEKNKPDNHNVGEGRLERMKRGIVKLARNVRNKNDDGYHHYLDETDNDKKSLVINGVD